MARAVSSQRDSDERAVMSLDATSAACSVALVLAVSINAAEQRPSALVRRARRAFALIHRRIRVRIVNTMVSADD